MMFKCSIFFIVITTGSICAHDPFQGVFNFLNLIGIPINNKGSASGCVCGKRPGDDDDDRIVGGVDTDIKLIPWIAQLRRRDVKFTQCGGTIINNRYILTAAHCVKRVTEEYYEVALGLSTRLEQDQEDTYLIEKIIRKPEFLTTNSTRNGHDVAVLRLNRDIKFSNDIQPICLPDFPAEEYNWNLGAVAGWGTTSSGGGVSTNLQSTLLWPVDHKICQFFPFTSIYQITLVEGHMCGAALFRDTCQGDSGGPFFLYRNSTAYQVGVTSFGKGCATVGNPGVYADITVYADWIRNVTADGSLPSCT